MNYRKILPVFALYIKVLFKCQISKYYVTFKQQNYLLNAFFTRQVVLLAIVSGNFCHFMIVCGNLTRLIQIKLTLFYQNDICRGWPPWSPSGSTRLTSPERAWLRTSATAARTSSTSPGFPRTRRSPSKLIWMESSPANTQTKFLFFLALVPSSLVVTTPSGLSLVRMTDKSV